MDRVPWTCVWRTCSISWVHIHTSISKGRPFSTEEFLPWEKMMGWTAPACLTEVLLRFAMQTITGYKHISTFKVNHKLFFLQSDALKVPVAKLTSSKRNLLWEVITQVVRSTDLCGRRQFLIFLVNHLNWPTTEQSGPQQLRYGYTPRRCCLQ